MTAYELLDTIIAAARLGSAVAIAERPGLGEATPNWIASAAPDVANLIHELERSNPHVDWSAVQPIHHEGNRTVFKMRTA